ncbi:MAG TPA: aminotransferase class III-fold pyridoxal phosphate-dependent enzyme [Candidatus Acidoferrales bacterium]|nr:aminotransferase class III-fold pyridoxal phosphate-dependent enzyme [Candidatus Acidoferrales bacterium]
MAVRPVSLKESKILRAFAEKTPGSRALHNRAKALLPDGITHVGRFLEPHPIYVERAAGSRKWDVDGNEYVDYLGGHGALILGHGFPAVVDAVTAQAAKGAHYGACHALEVQWAELIQRLMPSAERVRFTVTGTEATHLALRVARAFTGRSKIVRFAGHFHGWHDHVCFPAGGAPGIIAGIVEDTLLAVPNDLRQVEQWLASRNDIAALILEPTGATFGQIPTTGETLLRLRELTARHGVLLIFDEVISGFRCSPGGAQQFYGVTPDLTTLAKILAGGYPGAALAGRADVLSVLDYRRHDGALQSPLVAHQGTYNAGPVSAAAGIATLAEVSRGDATSRAARTAAAIRDGINAAIRRRGLPWCAYGQFSDFHLYRGPETPEEIHAGKAPWQALKGGIPLELANQIRAGFLLHGVDVASWPGGLVSAAHTDDDVVCTVAAFESTFDQLAAEGAL